MDVSQDALEAFASLFKGRTDARGTMDGGCLKEPVTIQSYQRHLQGDESLGVYPLLDNGTCWFAAVDLDEKDFKKALSIRQELYNAGIPAYISASRKKGYHIYMFSFSPDGPFVAKDIRKILSSVLSHLDIKAEIFPKQDVTSETIPFGNYINLPGFGFVRQFLDTEQHQIPTADAMTKIKGTPAESVARAVRVMPDVKEVTVKPPTGTPRGRPRKKGAPPCIEAILKGVSAGARDEAAFALARHYFDHEYLPEEVLGLLTVWDTRNKPPIGDIKELEAKVNSAKKGYAFGCGSIINNANLESVCVGQDKCKYFQKTEEERKKKGLLKELTFFEDDAHLYEQIQKKGGEPTFCCYEKESGQITYLPQIDLEKFSVVPYRGKAVDEGVLILPEGIEEYGDTLALMGAVKQHILDYVDIPDIMAEMSAWYVLMTWTYDRLPTVPYLRFRGDTGCLIAGTKVVLADGSFVNIETLGERHLQEINVPLRIVGQRGALIAPATKFYKYENEPVRRLRTETGKEITGTYNHPFLVKKEGTPYESEWKELRYLKVGDKLRTATSLSGRTGKGNVTRAGLLGYLLGDGWVRQTRESMALFVSEKEKELIPILTGMIERELKVTPNLQAHSAPADRQPGHVLEVNGKAMESFGYMRDKKVPDEIMRGTNSEIASFLAWFFTAEGCVYSKGRGKRAIVCTQKDTQVLRDVQMLLLRFGIHSRITGKDLYVRRSESILKFIDAIGFRVLSKTHRMWELYEDVRLSGDSKRGRTPWEQIVAIEDAGTATVYDVEVPGPHCFVANGLISHNCGKSRALSVIGELCYKPMLVSGAVTPAPIYRVIEMFRGTLIIDEANLNDSSEKGEVVTILNCGFERNRPIIRCTKDGDSWEPSIFPCFGPKLFSTRQGFEDKALESRCITHIMEETDRDDMPYILNNAFHQRQAHFRKQLLLYRLRNWSKIDPGQVDGIDLGHIEPRLKQTGLTFSLSFRDYPEALAHFKDFIKLYNRTLIGERADSDDGKLALAFLRKTQELGRGEVAASDIADFLLNELKMEHYDARKVGRRMTSLGLKTVKQSRIHGYKHYYQYDIAQIKRLIRRYMTEPDEFKDLITNEEVDIDV